MSNPTHARQGKNHSVDPDARVAKSIEKAAYSAKGAARIPAWTSAWGDRPTIGLISPIADLQAKGVLSRPGDPYEQEADQAAAQIMHLTTSGSAPMATPPDSPGVSSSPAGSVSHVSPMIQRAPAEEGSTSTPTTDAAPESAPTSDGATTGSAPEAVAPSQTPAPGLIVEDSVDQLAPGQMKKSDFLAQLRNAVCTTTEEALKGTLWSAAGCPWVDHWFGFYSNRDSQQIERALRRYAPETARVTSASDYIPIICERVRRAITRWSTTGEITGVPEDASTGLPDAPSAEGAEVSSSENKVSFKGRDGGARETSDPQAIRGQLGSGRSLDSGVKSHMESAYGVDFSHVRVHTDARAANLSNSLNARAFTVGEHVAFGSGEYQPGTLIGDALIAHELAHVMQQEGSALLKQKDDTAYNALEEDADMSAVGAIVSLWSGAKGVLANINQNAIPRLRSGLRLQGCKRRSIGELEIERDKINGLIGNPEANADEVIRIIDGLGSDASTVLMRMGLIKIPGGTANESALNELAGSEAGQRILVRISQALRDGDLLARDIGKTIDRILSTRTSATPPQISQDQQKIINRINAAINADPRREQYGRAALPLRLPVQIYQTGMEMSGGVYYDQSMPKTLPGDAGITVPSTWQSKGQPTQYPLIYIKLGPLALSFSDEFIRSVLWHEFQHYRRILEFRQPDASKSADTKTLEQELLAGGSADPRPNMELEATSIQLADDFDRLSDDEIMAVLRYLEGFLVMAGAQQQFKDAAIDRINVALKGNRDKQDRLLRLIGKLSRTQRTNLSTLSKVIRANLAPRPKPSGSRH